MEILKYDLKFSALEGKLDLVLKEVKKWSDEFNDLRNGLTFVNEKFEDFKKEMAAIVVSHSSIVKENLDIKNQLVDLKNELGSLKAVMEENECEKNCTSLELTNVQFKTGEIVENTVLKLANAVGLKIGKQQLVKVFRKGVRKNGTPGDIMVKLDTKDSKNMLMKAIKQKRLTNKMIGFDKENSNIYVRELLTKNAKELFFCALTFKKDKKWQYLWTADGKIFLRKDANGRAMKILSKLDLDKLQE